VVGFHGAPADPPLARVTGIARHVALPRTPSAGINHGEPVTPRNEPQHPPLMYYVDLLPEIDEDDAHPLSRVVGTAATIPSPSPTIGSC